MQRRDVTQRKGDRKKWIKKNFPLIMFYVKREQYRRVEKSLQLYHVWKSKAAHYLHMPEHHLHLQQQTPALQKKGSAQRKGANETIK